MVIGTYTIPNPQAISPGDLIETGINIAAYFGCNQSYILSNATVQVVVVDNIIGAKHYYSPSENGILYTSAGTNFDKTTGATQGDLYIEWGALGAGKDVYIIIDLLS